jgi:long-subunit fatty acid transport protein
MKLRGLTFTIATLGMAGTASAGGLFLPGAGSISTARAGAAVASAQDGEALSLNPAGLAKSKGTTITIGIAAIDYLMSFQRNGSYDPITEEDQSYEGQRYPLITNDPHPPLGIGPMQPVPVIAVVSDFGGAIPHFHGAFGLYAPMGYPFRGMNNVNGKPYFIKDGDGYTFPTFGEPPPPTRYDIIEQEAAVIFPSIGAAYSITPDLDVGLRLSAGLADLKSTVAIWGVPANYEEWIQADGVFTIHAKDNFVPAYGLGTAYRPTPNIELGANFTGPVDIHAQGDAQSVNGPAVTLNGTPIVISPVADADARCARGGTMQKLKGCVDVELPMTATIGGRYKLLDDNGKLKGDIELNIGWEHWGKSCDYIKDPLCLNPSDYRVVVDGQVGTASMPNGLALKDSLITHGFQDTYAVRLGGSYAVTDAIVARGGVSHDTAAAKTGWERIDVDGAARTMIAAGGSYKTGKMQFDGGFGFIYEGTRTDSRSCNPTAGPNMGCQGNGIDNPIDKRQGPDPTNPILAANVQSENPVNQGTYKSHYIMVMLGFSTWF